MRNIKCLLPALLIGLAAGEPGLVIDGKTADWGTVPPVFTSSAFLRELRVVGDERRVYLRLTFDRELNIHALPGTLTLAANGEAEISFSSDGISVSTLDRGVARPAPTGVSDLGIAAAPSFAARDVEIGIARGWKGLLAGRAVRWRLYVRDGSGKLIEQRSFSTALPALRISSPPEDKIDPLRRAPNAGFRVVAWNIARRRWQENPEPYRRVLRALQPDIVLLDEVSDQTSSDFIASFLRSLRPEGSPWNFVIAKTVGTERGLVGSTLPMTAAIGELRHREETLRQYGISAAGAYVTMGSRTLLVTAIDLVCCGNAPGSKQEQRREAEVAVISEALREALRTRTANAVITGGDLNLVSTRKAMDMLRWKMDPAGGDLAEDESLRLDGKAMWTWSGPPGEPSQFVKGKLDYLLHSPSTLVLERSFVFDSADLGAKWREHHQIQAADSTVSDHRPVVADYRWR